MGVGASAGEVVDGVRIDGDDKLGGRAEDPAGAEAGIIGGGYSKEGVRVFDEADRQMERC